MSFPALGRSVRARGRFVARRVPTAAPVTSVRARAFPLFRLMRRSPPFALTLTLSSLLTDRPSRRRRARADSDCRAVARLLGAAKRFSQVRRTGIFCWGEGAVADGVMDDARSFQPMTTTAARAFSSGTDSCIYYVDDTL